MMADTKPVYFTCPTRLLEDFDKMCTRKYASEGKYSDRKEALLDAMRLLLQKEKEA